MFGRIFNSENGVFKLIDKIADIMGLSVLWVICSLPLVTMGAATSALYYSFVKCVRRGEKRTYGNFFSALKDNFKTALVINLILLPLLALGVWGRNNLVELINAGESGLALWYAALSVVMFLLLALWFFVFPLISRFDLKPLPALAAAFRLCIRRLPSAIAVTAVNTALLLISLRYVMVVLPIVFAPALGAFVASLFLEPIFRGMTPGHDSAPEDDKNKPWYLR